MSMTIDLPEEIGNRLRAGAERNGLSLSKYIEHLLAMEKPPRPVTLQETLSPEEFVKALRAWAESHDPNLPVLSDEAMSRESIYGERGL